MRKHIKKLKEKPERVRKQVVIAALVLCMIFILIIWLISLNNKFNKNNVYRDKKQEEIKPFNLFGQSIENTYNNISDNLDKASSVKEKIEVKTDSEATLTPVE